MPRPSSDDAKIPMHLWNNHVNIPGLPKGRRDKALDAIRQLGLHFFKTSLLTDCCEYMARMHGLDWKTKPRRDMKGGALNKLWWDQEAMANLLWHLTHTSWFEYNAGSDLVHCKFPERYCKEARDGVRPFFEKPGPTMRWTQPTIEEPGIRAKVMEKIDKIIRRRYLLTFCITIKS